MIVITIPGEAETGTMRFTLTGRRYMPANVKDFRATVKMFAKQVCPEPLSGPLAVTITARKCKPQSWPKKPTKGNPWPWSWWKKPDPDNVSKPVLDALTGVVWHDDAQIVSLTVRKEFWHLPEVQVTAVRVQEHYAPGSGSGAPAGAAQAAVPEEAGQ